MRGAAGYDGAPSTHLTRTSSRCSSARDFVEPDLVMTRDGVLIARHENEIGGTTGCSRAPASSPRAPHAAQRRRHRQVEGWFTEDFTLAELKTLRARERIPEVRPANTRLTVGSEIPTLAEILALVQGVEGQRAARARQLGPPPPARIGVSS